jgi:hypothetical protein
LSDVIPEIDIWRAAALMLKRYGDKALDQSRTRVDALAADGDHDGAEPGAGCTLRLLSSPTPRHLDRCTDRNAPVTTSSTPCPYGHFAREWRILPVDAQSAAQRARSAIQSVSRN